MQEKYTRQVPKQQLLIRNDAEQAEREDKARKVPVMVTEKLIERNFSGPFFATTTVRCTFLKMIDQIKYCI